MIAMDLPSKLLQQRIISIPSVITMQSAKVVRDSLKYLTSLNKEDITLQIDCVGGCAYSCFSIIDAMNWTKNQGISVNTIVEGIAASAGALILINGSKRYGTKLSTIMFHHVVSEVSGSYSDLTVSYNETKRLNNIAYKLVCDNTEIDPVWETLERDYYISAEEALEQGVIDAIL